MCDLRFVVAIVLVISISQPLAAQEFKLYGQTQKLTELPELDLNQLLPEPYKILHPLLLADGKVDQTPVTCKKWEHFSQGKKSSYSRDKFTQIALTNIRNFCWLVEKIAHSKKPTVFLGTIDDLAKKELFPAGLLYHGFTSEKEYVRDTKIVPTYSKDFSIEISPLVTVDTQAIRRLIWGKEQASLSVLEQQVFEPSLSMISPTVSLAKSGPYNIEGQFLRTISHTSIIAQGFDYDGDGIEDWGLINDIHDATGNASLCFPAIISRRGQSDTTLHGSFVIKETVRAQRCG